jgi:hypothetical protein
VGFGAQFHMTRGRFMSKTPFRDPRRTRLHNVTSTRFHDGMREALLLTVIATHFLRPAWGSNNFFETSTGTCAKCYSASCGGSVSNPVDRDLPVWS